MIHWILQYTLRKLRVNNFFNEVLKLDILTFLLFFLHFYPKPGGLAGRSSVRGHYTVIVLSSHFLHFYPKPGGLAGRSSVRDHHTITLLF